MTAVTAEQMAEWKALADAATEGGWFIVRYGDGDSYVIHSDDERRIFFPPSPIGFSATAGSLGDPAQIKADMKFVAASRTAVPSLLAEVERLREALRKIDARRYQGRYTVTPEMAWAEFVKANAKLCAIYDEARAALEDGT